MAQYINKDTYIGDTGKQLKDILTNADNISNLQNNKQDKLTTNRVAISTSNSVKVYRYGNVVSVDIDGYIQESNGIIATGLPIPVYLVYLTGLNYSDGWIAIDSSGNLRVTNHTAGNWINFHGVYICN